MTDKTLSILFIVMLALPAVSAADETLPRADSIVVNARIVTMDDTGFSTVPGTIAEAMAISGDAIVAVGDKKDIEALAGPGTRTLDLGGRTVLPGFVLTGNDITQLAWTDPVSLRHVFPDGNEDLVVEILAGDAGASWEAALQSAVARAAPGQWILLRYDAPAAGQPADMPSIVTPPQLDELAPENPVFISYGQNGGLLNALARAHLESGLSGEAVESVEDIQPHTDLVLAGRTALVAELLKAQMQIWAAHGFTVFASRPDSAGSLESLRLLDESGGMPGRFAWIADAREAGAGTTSDAGTITGEGSNSLWNIGAAPGFSEGTCTSLPLPASAAPDGCSLEPGDPRRHAVEEIVRTGGRIVAEQLAGDRDLDYLLDIIEEQSEAAEIPIDEVRALRHAFGDGSGAPRPDQVQRILELGMTASLSNTTIWENGREEDASARLRSQGADFVHWSVPRASLTDSGIRTAQGLVRTPPQYLFYGLWAGVTRYNAGIDLVLAPGEATGLVTQLKALTSWGAYYVLREDRLGSLEAGKLADFVVLDRDPLSVPRDEIPQLKVLMTVVGGVPVYLATGLADELDQPPAGAATWPAKPLEARYGYAGPPGLPEARAPSH